MLTTGVLTGCTVCARASPDSAHLAAILPFYGRSTGTSHPCLVMYRRDGQTFTLNPYHAGDRVRVAHMTLFGPTGSGKSATAIAHAMQSMAVSAGRADHH